VGVQYVVISPQNLALPPPERWLICGGVALTLLSLGLIHLTTTLSRPRARRLNHAAYHFGTALALILLAAVGVFRPLILIAILALACAVQVVREVVGQLRSNY